MAPMLATSKGDGVSNDAHPVAMNVIVCHAPLIVTVASMEDRIEKDHFDIARIVCLPRTGQLTTTRAS